MPSNMKTVFSILLFVFFVETETASSTGGRCEKITIPYCKKLGYNRTIFPNILEHDTQEEARRHASEFTSLIDAQCSPDIVYFLCSLHAPVCTMMGSALPPCRSLCKSARNGCESLMENYGFKWPKSFSCNRFPKASKQLCVGRNSSSTNEGQSKKTSKRSGKKVFREKRCSSASGRGKFCCKLGRKAAKRGFYCNLKKKRNTDTRRSIKFRKLVIRKCSKHSSCFRSCCKKRQRRRAAKRRYL